MKICFVYCYKLLPERVGFSEQHPCRLANIMRDNASIYALYSGTADETLFRMNGVTPIKMSPKWFTKGYLIRMLALLVYTYRVGKEHNIDVFMNVWSHYLMLPIWIGAKLCGTKAVASIGGVPIRNQLAGIAWRKRFRRILGLSLEWVSLMVVPKIHVVSHSLKTEFSRRGIPKDKISVISRGINLSLFGERKRQLTCDRNRELEIGTVGRIVSGKDLRTLVLAVEHMRLRGHRVRLHIAGNGDQKDDIVKLVSERRLDSSVIFHGQLPQTELADFYSQLDVFVLSSVSEGIANVVLEALAMGLPVVATNTGDIPLHLEEGRGRLFNVGNASELAEILEQEFLSVTDEQDQSLKSENRKKYVVENHSFRSLEKKYEAFFLSIS